MTQERFLSLFDYLGKAAGKELGAQVAVAAAADKVVMQMKEISNPVYKGKVMMYPESWLKKYFLANPILIEL